MNVTFYRYDYYTRERKRGVCGEGRSERERERERERDVSGDV